MAAGQKLFSANCTACHAVNKKVIGPALANVWERAPSQDWLYRFIKNSTKVIASGDEYAVNLYNEYNKTQMTSFTSLKDNDIDNILAYVKSETGKVDGPVPPTEGGPVVVAETGVDSTYITAVMVILVIVLLLILVVLGLMVNILTKVLRDKEDLEEADSEIVNQKTDLGKFFSSNGVVGLLVFIIVALGMKAGIDGLFTVGVQQNYQPKQPIAFSHQIHAGTYEIDCQYCHTGVRKAKSANIPSANICMNCHSAIKTESAEIQKIYAAIDYDPETLTYGENTKPIEWVRIHNLPDLAYFNHSQHVQVGGLECETCHGEIKEMQVVYQYSPLTMGWCINCHRETNVNAKGNGYYNKLVELHDDNNGKTPMKVEDIGGLECSKCHY
ncbi:MAG: c-type cytochrome [Cyclobacteriaceae bacterium]